MTNEVGKALFAKAGELGVPVGFMCMKVCCILSSAGNFCIQYMERDMDCVLNWDLILWSVTSACSFIEWVDLLQGLNLHILEIEELCAEFPSTVVLLDHVAFCRPPLWAFFMLINWICVGFVCKAAFQWRLLPRIFQKWGRKSNLR